MSAWTIRSAAAADCPSILRLWRAAGFYRLAVHPVWRRQGLGTALVRAAAGYRRQEDRTRFVRELPDLAPD